VLSAKQLCQDNHCAAEFDSSFGRLNDSTTGDVLLQASSVGAIYIVLVSALVVSVPTLPALVPANVITI